MRDLFVAQILGFMTFLLVAVEIVSITERGRGINVSNFAAIWKTTKDFGIITTTATI